MQARAAAVDELMEAGTLEDFTSSGESPLDRELAEISSQSQIEADLERLRAEVGAGEKPKEIEG
jgi:phage shock protein A